MNNIRISGWVNSRLFESEKVVAFYLRFGIKKTIRVVAFRSTTQVDCDQKDYVEVEGRLDVEDYNGKESYAIIADSVVVSRPPKSDNRKSYSKTGYQKQPYQPRKSYDI